MSDPDSAPEPVTGHESPVPASLMTFIRQIMLAVSFLTTVLGFLNVRDVVGLVAWLQSTEGVSALAAAVWLATMAFGLFRTVRLHDFFVRVAKSASPLARLK
jgi:hypothetical protein